MKYIEFRHIVFGLAAAALILASCTVDDSEGAGALAGASAHAGLAGNAATGALERASNTHLLGDTAVAGESATLDKGSDEAGQLSGPLVATGGAFIDVPAENRNADVGSGGAAATTTLAATGDAGAWCDAGQAGTSNNISAAGDTGSSVPSVLLPRGGASAISSGGALASGGRGHGGSAVVGALPSGGAAGARNTTAGSAGFHVVWTNSNVGGLGSVGGAVSSGGSVAIATTGVPLGGSWLGVGGQSTSGPIAMPFGGNAGGVAGASGTSGTGGVAGVATSGTSSTAGTTGETGSELPRMQMSSAQIEPGDTCDPLIYTVLRYEAGGLSETCLCSPNSGTWVCIGSLVETCALQQGPGAASKCCPSVPYESTTPCDTSVNFPVCLYYDGSTREMSVTLCQPDGSTEPPPPPTWINIGPDAPCPANAPSNGAECYDVENDTNARLFTICPYSDVNTTCVCNTDTADWSVTKFYWACYSTP